MSNLPENRCFAALCLALARQASDAAVRESLTKMSQKWLDLSELAAEDDWTASLRQRAQSQIGGQLRSVYELPHVLPPHFLALLAELNAETASEEE